MRKKDFVNLEIKPPKIGIIGGLGAMGSWFSNFFNGEGFEVLISDLSTPLSNKDLAKKADIIIVSVPIKETTKVIEEISPFLKRENLVCDVASLKNEVIKTMKKLRSGALGMHPLFGPLSPSLKNQTLIFYPVHKHPLIDFLKNLFQKKGAKIIKLSPKEHDYQMAILQAMVHFLNICFGHFLAQKKFLPKNYFLTPTFKLQSLVLGRILGQKPELYSQIEIENPFFKEILTEFEKEIKQFSEIIKNKNYRSFERKFKMTQNYLKDFVQIAQLKSNEVLSVIERQPIKVSIPTIKKIDLESAKVGFLGPEGTHCFEATKKIFSKRTKLFPFLSIGEIFEALLSQKINIGVVPAENTVGGIVPETIHLLISYPLSVSGSYTLSIQHSLLAKTKKMNDIKIIKTHPQAFLQCKNWLGKNLPQVEFLPTSSTVAPILKEKSKKVGFIASERAAKVYKLSLLAKNIQDHKENFTKFYLLTPVLNRKLLEKLKAKKTLILFAVYDRVGILRDILDVFAKANLNLSALHSIPSHSKPWDYFFFVEIEAPLLSTQIKKALKNIRKYCLTIRVVGAS